jgi:general stress protein CsbA
VTNEPLGLPRGSVRAILTLLLLVAVVLTVFIPAANTNALDALLVLAGIAVRDYFTIRKQQNDTDGPPLAKPVTND